MPKIRFTPGDISVEAEEGSSLLEVARRAGFVLQSECGGQGTCRRCKVRLLSGDVFPTCEQNLTTKEKENNYVLSCVARIVDDLEVEVPGESELKFLGEAAALERSPGEDPSVEIKTSGGDIDPLVTRLKLQISEPTLQNNASDYSRFCHELKKNFPDSIIQTNLSSLQELSQAIRSNHGTMHPLIYVTENGVEVIRPSLLEDSIYGIALDVGTTTLFARLIDLQSGEIVAEASDYNSQIPCGGDIIHRIVYAGRSGGLEELQNLIISSTNGLIERMTTQTELSAESIVACCLAGNTTMQHLFLGLDPKTIREEPYVPTVTHFPYLRAAEIGIEILTDAPLFVTPSVASYIGGDITAGLLAAQVHKSDRLTLYVDLGTNGEVALGNKEWLTACACSAGPAFEGSGVKCGTRAIPGGIDRVSYDATLKQLLFHTIGGGIPRGICGSGMIDLLAELRATDRITPHGKLNLEADPGRIRKTGRKAEIVLVRGGEEDGSNDIVLTEPDIDNLIRTKGAIFAGIMTLLNGVGLEVSSIARVVIAGSFGHHLDIENSIRIGMLPDLPRDRFEYIGNGALRGAGLALLSKQMWRELHDISQKVTYFELSTWPGYMDEFMASLFLPHTDGSLFPTIK